MDKPFAQLYLDNQLCFPLYAASRLITKIYAPYLNALDITYPQYLVLLVLWEHKSQTVNEIGERLILESNTLTPLLKRMEQKDLIHRTRSKADERSVIITISDKGDKLRNQAATIPEKLIESLRDASINDKEIQDFRLTLRKLIALMNR